MKTTNLDQLIHKLKRTVIFPNLDRRDFGKLYYVNIDYFISDERMDELRILHLFERGLLTTLARCQSTDYFLRKFRKGTKFNYKGQQIKKGGAVRAYKRVFKYYFLYKSIKKNGLLISSHDRRDYPTIFLCKDFDLPFDGAHRASIAKLLGYTHMPTAVITPDDVRTLENLPEDIKTFVESIDSPDLTTLEPVIPSQGYYKI